MKTYFAFILTLTLLLTACAPKPTPTSTAPAAPAPTQPAAVTQTAAMPTATPDHHTPDDGYGPETPNPPAAANTQPAPTLPALQNQGQVYFSDKLATADQLVLDMGGAPLPAPEQVYVGWLLAEGGSRLNAGVIPIQADGSAHLEWTSPDGKNLFSAYTGFEITLEAAGFSASAPAGPLAYQGTFRAEQIEAARSMFVSNQGEPATPRNQAFAPALLAQTQIALNHFTNSANAAGIGATRETMLHLEHAINILEGSAGPLFKDYDGDGKAQNPGDGFGVVQYARQISLRVGTPEAQEAFMAFENEVVRLQDACIKIFSMSDKAEIRAALESLSTDMAALEATHARGLYMLAERALTIQVIPVP